MASNNIFAVIQSVAENSDSQVKLFNILKENGYTGTLEEAGNELTQASQAMLENLTSEDLKNIAGGKSLMTDKLKKIIAVGGASLMAGTAAVPTHAASGTQTGANSTQTKAGNNIINHMKEHPIHSTATAAFALTTVGSILLHIIHATKKGPELQAVLGDHEFQKLIRTLEKGAKLLDFLALDLTNTKSKSAVKLEAFTGESGGDSGVGKNAAESYVKITKGETNDGICANGELLHGLHEAKVKLEGLAVYMVYTAAGATKKHVTKGGDLSGKFKPQSTDTDLSSYNLDNLNEDGQFLARLIIGKLLDSQSTYAE